MYISASYYNRHSHETILYIRLTEKFIPFFQDESSISNPAGQKRLHFAGIAQYVYKENKLLALLMYSQVPNKRVYSLNYSIFSS